MVEPSAAALVPVMVSPEPMIDWPAVTVMPFEEETVPVAVAYVAPELAAMRPVKVESTGALLKVCVPPQVLEVVVPKAKETVLVERVMGYVNVRGFS